MQFNKRENFTIYPFYNIFFSYTMAVITFNDCLVVLCSFFE